ncbi:hypothetical protein ABB37_09744 [Leptomonas pyrrhocoris]|uniref:Uncharacterized protein n=1 Tax=Leptomonas pyrrhocoris TaxID=157538 RepID=A0A0N0DQS6_LEPPY|nr:hypothetical protein ABB37_09744 [Leptomonas pyrrhocoris]KPA73612.1 hypothetical protein ABB37_09744 [Leptomonas pyrrhocoris]|eukprot:XP_015652051.1 hypothetical protein ABB37_09744 [Leptomonas pyrrhocoris]
MYISSFFYLACFWLLLFPSYYYRVRCCRSLMVSLFSLEMETWKKKHHRRLRLYGRTRQDGSLMNWIAIFFSFSSISLSLSVSVVLFLLWALSSMFWFIYHPHYYLLFLFVIRLLFLSTN